ncbi:MAG: hypothetical protein FWG73_02505 [Planctomycetaceae bacterium]|nr:hypothetical protein [Planctomycetaceae bacterium]
MLRFLLCLAVVCCLAEPLQANILSVRVGIEERYKNGLWTTITVNSSEQIQTLAVRSSDSDGTPITYHYEGDGMSKTTVLAKLGRKDAPIQVSVNGGAFQSFDVPMPVNAERPIYLIFGNDDIGLQGAVAELMLREDRRPLLVKINSVDELPTKWFGYESVEMVVLTTTEPELFAGLAAESPQIQALHTWLQLGGKMLLCVGQNAEQFLADETGWLHLFLPGRFDGMTELRNGNPFERFAGSQRQIFMNGTDEAPFMRMPRIVEPRGIIFVQDGDLPLVLQSTHGLGMMLYFASDLSGRPLNHWRDRTTLVRNMMQWNRAQQRAALAPRSGAMLQLGYNDIAGQIRSALDQFEGVHVVPFSVILLILTAYWLVIGLFDWYFVHKVLKKPILTWLTFPLWIVLFGFLTYALAVPGRPNAEKHNVLTLYDVDVATGIVRESTWESVYSPRDAIVSRLRGEQSADNFFSWFGLPGSGLGGMAPNTVSPSVWQTGSEQVDYGQIVNVPIQTRSTKIFFGTQPITAVREPLNFAAGSVYVAQLADDEGIPVGTIEFRGDLPITNAILVYGRWALELGEITPGQTVTITKTTPRRDLRDLLIPPHTLDNENLRRLATYNPQSKDLEYIVRVLSLHRVLGGFEATGLHHAYMPSLDMSDLLLADRALLLGGALSDSATVVYRASLPIELTATSPRLGRERRELLPDALDAPIRPGYIEVP